MFNRIYDALKDDIFLIRLKQLAWQEYCSQKYVVNISYLHLLIVVSDSSGDLNSQIYSVLDDIGIKEVICYGC